MTSILFGACSADKQAPEKGNILPSDTTLNFHTATQHMKIAINKSGLIESVEINPDKHSQTIYFDTTGIACAMKMRKDSVDEQTLYFNSTGQIEKIKSFDNDETNGGDQFIWFSPSATKSLLIDHDKSHTPIVCGLKDKFKLDTTYRLLFQTLDDRTEKSYVLIHDINYDTNFVSLQLDKGKSNQFTISSKYAGTFRIKGSVATKFLKPEPYAILNKFDFNVTFR